MLMMAAVSSAERSDWLVVHGEGDNMNEPSMPLGSALEQTAHTRRQRFSERYYLVR